MTSPPWSHRWSALAVCTLFQAYTIGLVVYSFTLWIKPFMTEFGSERAPIVALASLSGLVMAAAAPLAGWASDRVAIKYVVGAGVLSFATGMLLVSRVSNLGQLSAVYGTLLPIGAAFAGPVAAQAVVTRAFARRKGMALGISWAGTAFGGLVRPPVVAALIQSEGWRLTHVYLSLLGFALAVPVLLVLGRDRVILRPTTGGAGPPPSLLGILRTPRFWTILLAIVPISIVFASVQFNIGPLASDLRLGGRSVGFALSLLAATMIAAKLSFGTLADRLDYRFLLWACMGAMLAAVAALSIGTGPGFYVGVMFLGIAGGGFLPLVGLIFADRFRGDEYGRAIGLCFLALNATYIGPWLAARIRDLNGGYIATFQWMLVLLVPAALAVGLLRCTNIAAQVPLQKIDSSAS